jgi:hypothetical protein
MSPVRTHLYVTPINAPVRSTDVIEMQGRPAVSHMIDQREGGTDGSAHALALRCP